MPASLKRGRAALAPFPTALFQATFLMALDPGTLLGRYEIRSHLGSGGMGEVYLAHDTQLERMVALKILLQEFAADQQRMQRFVQEARAASALNHPNIITIHEIGSSDATHFIATEFIDGETLRQRMRTARLSTAAVKWSPDGRALLYVETRGGISNLMSQPIDGSAAKITTGQ